MQKTKPNLVLIMADQWRGDCLGLAGHPHVQTPNLDLVFSDGAIFNQAYSAVPSCIAARVALLTGMEPKNHGRIGYQDRVRWNYPTTLPGTLAHAGYHTHCVGKMHVSPARSLMGFHSVQLHDGYLHAERRQGRDYTQVDDYLPWFREHCGSDVDITDAAAGCNGYTVTPWPHEERYHPTNWVTSQSIDFLRRRDPEKPFFLKVSYHRPHPPLDPPQHYLDRYLNMELPPPLQGNWSRSKLPRRGIDAPIPGSPAQIDLARKAYLAQLTHIDAQINRLIHGLNEHNLLDNTLLLFISDHGDLLYDHNMVAKAEGHAGSAKIPFMIRFPNSWKERPATPMVDALVELRDVMPTLLDAAGVEIPDSVDGQSVLPLCRGQETSWRSHLHGEHAYGETSNHWINTGRELYIWYSQTGEEQYFDLVADPNNCNNLARKQPGRVAELRKILIHELEGREEGYVQNGELVIGRTPLAVLAASGQELPG